MASNPGGRNGGASSMGEYGVLAILGLFMLALLCMLWFVASPLLGRVYLWSRVAETSGLWLFTGWGRYFWSVPKGQPFLFASPFYSSVPFNLFFGLVIALLGVKAYRKVVTRHIDAHIRSDKPLDYRDLMRLQAPLFPANEFFLLFPLKDYPLDRGPARLPMTALELLVEADALVGIHDTAALRPGGHGPRGWAIDEDRVTERLVSVFGPPNPFARPGFGFTDPVEIRRALDVLPWHLVLLVHVCLQRIQALGVAQAEGAGEDGFAQVMLDTDAFLKDVWRELCAHKRRAGDRLALGFVDADDRVLKLALAREKDPKAGVQSLREYLDEQVEHRGVAARRADGFDAVVRARAGILQLLTDHLDRGADRPVPRFRDAKGCPKRLSDLSPVERQRYEIARKAQVKAVTETIRTLLCKNAYAFGLAATLLTEARRAGTLPPALFRWMRFYDRGLWSFLRCHGGNAPVPEVAGMWDHYQVEEKAESPLRRPYLTSAVEGVRLEASKYITDKMRGEFAVVRARAAAAGKASEASRAMVRGMARTIVDGLRADPLGTGAPEGNPAA